MNEPKRYELSTFVRPDPPVQPPAPVDLPAVVDLVQRDAGGIQVRQADDALTHAKATLLVSAAYVAAALVITVGLLLIVWLFRGLGEGWAAYVYAGLLLWGIATLLALWANRRQSLHHSPTGIAHHEIDSRERLAHHALNLHAKLLRERWTHERRQTPDD